MLPSRSQFRRWTYPTKFAFVSFFVGLFVSVALSVALWLFPETGTQLIARLSSSNSGEALVGTWKGITNYTLPNAQMVESGYMRLLSSGRYAFSGEIAVRNANGMMELQFTALAAGTWSATDGGFVLTASDFKMTPRTLKQPGKPDVDLTHQKLLIRETLASRIEELALRGMSQEYEVVEITSKRLRARSSDIQGSSVAYEAMRQ